MNSENQEVIYCADDAEYRVYCNVCDKLCLERFYENNLKSRTHTKNIRKRENSIIFISNLTEPKTMIKHQLKGYMMKTNNSKEF